MEFHEKIKKLRLERNWTQDDLAEQLFVSRTAISKWENGKGYPNIDTLKQLSMLFSISIDELLATSEVLDMVEKENAIKAMHLKLLVTGILDVFAILLILLPLYGREAAGHIYMETLIAKSTELNIATAIFWLIPLLLISLGILEVCFSRATNFSLQKSKQFLLVSCGLQILFVSLYIMANQPYATFLLFLFLALKFVVLLKSTP